MNVKVVGTTPLIQTTTNAEGKFTLPEVPFATYTLEYSKTGFGTFKKIGVIHGTNGQATFISDIPSLGQLSTTTVTTLPRRELPLRRPRQIDPDGSKIRLREAVVADPATGRILSAEIVGKDAGELIHVFSVAVTMRATVHDLLRAHWYHPTLPRSSHSTLQQAPAGAVSGHRGGDPSGRHGRAADQPDRLQAGSAGSVNIVLNSLRTSNVAFYLYGDKGQSFNYYAYQVTDPTASAVFIGISC